MVQFYRPLLDAGVEIYEYSKRFLHAKTSLIDRWAIVGSSNLNSRSLVHDLEVDYILQTEERMDELERFFIQVMQESERIRNVGEASGWWQYFGRLFLLFRYWI